MARDPSRFRLVTLPFQHMASRAAVPETRGLEVSNAVVFYHGPLVKSGHLASAYLQGELAACPVRWALLPPTRFVPPGQIICLFAVGSVFLICIHHLVTRPKSGCTIPHC